MRNEMIAELDTPTLLKRLALAVVTFLGIVVVLALTLREPIEAISGDFATRFGLAGLAAAVFSLDLFPFTTHDPVLLAAYTGGLGYVPVLVVSASASFLAAWVDWAIGRYVGPRLPFLKRAADRNGVSKVFARYGTAALVVCALLPTPFALVALVAGALGRPPVEILAASLLRGIKVLVALTVIALGWGLGN